MNYPLISEYIEAVKSAEDNFDELSYLRPVLNDDDMPVMSVGGFSVVFKMKDKRDGKFYALKCFTKEQERRTESYKLIEEELEFVSSNYITPIKYLEKELFVDTDQSVEDEFPVLLMDWVEGRTLDAYIKENINNQYALDILAYQFNKMASWLLTQPFAHGDLKPDNIIIKDDGLLVLVDYDGMYVPAMKGYKARETGSPGFRHPSRTEDAFDEHIDDFSIASIALALKAIALKPVLWDEYGGSDRLLFTEKDFCDLSQSDVISSLQCLMTDKEFCTLYAVFMIAWSRNDLSFISYRLLNIEKTQKENLQKAVSSYYKGKNCIKTKNYERAYHLFSSLTKKEKTMGRKINGLGNLSGFVLGANGLGYMYAYGHYVQQDKKKAVYWFKQASDKGFSMSQFNLGICYEIGFGVIRDMEEANRLYLLSAENNFGPAQSATSREIHRSVSVEVEAEMNEERIQKITSNFII